MYLTLQQLSTWHASQDEVDAAVAPPAADVTAAATPPEFTQPPQDVISVSEGSEIRINFKISGS